MKVFRRTALLPIFILVTAAICAYTVPAPAAEPPAEPTDAAEIMPDEVVPDTDFFTDILENLKRDDPNEAARLEKLQQENPRLFQRELRKLAWRQRARHEDFEPGRFHQMEDISGEGGGPMDRMGRSKRFERLHDRETELLSWLEKNEPETAKALAELKEKDPPAYRRRLSIETRKHRQIIEAAQTNPALAELLKKDLGLKQKRNELLEKLKSTTDETQKEGLTAQLKEVIGERFDIVLQKKQLQYEELKTRVEKLQQDVIKSQAELENFKNKKDEHIEKRLEEVLSKAEQIDWD